MTTENSKEMQEVLFRMMITDYSLYTRVSNIYNPDNFDKTLRPAAKFLKTFAEKYNAIPSPEQILAETGIKMDLVPPRDSDGEWFLNTFESFTRRQELERAILKSAELLEKGDYDPVEKLIKDAVQISLTKDLGTDYFSDPRARLNAIRDNNGQVSTGWPCLDHKLYGGFNRGELQIFAGGSGSGKSLFMQNLAVNWADQGLNGVYITLELSEQLCSKRMDSMITDISQKDIFKNLDDVELKLKMFAKHAGKLMVKYLPAQSNVNDIRAYIKTLQIEQGIKVDYICVDYLDLLSPVSVKIGASDLFVKDKYVSEEVRNLAKELNVLLVTASQLNRSAVEEIEFDHSHISGGISKINTADNVFGIFTSRAMRERGQYQIQLMKTRSSSGVGQKIDLSFNMETLRIYDDGDSTGTVAAGSTMNNVLSKIRGTTAVQLPTYGSDSDDGDDIPSPQPQGKIQAQIQSKKLSDMLKNMKR